MDSFVIEMHRQKMIHLFGGGVRRATWLEISWARHLAGEHWHLEFTFIFT